MGNGTAYRLTLGGYWLFLGVWIGAMVMLAVGAGITFKTVRDYQPTLHKAPYDDPALADRAAAILAGGIVGNTLKGLAVIQMACAAVVVVSIIAQCTLFARRLRGGATGWLNIARVALVVLPVAVLAADRLVVTPRVWELRQTMYDPSRTVETRAAAKAEFDRYHKMNERMVGLATLMLAGAMLTSAFVLHQDRQ